MRSDLPLNLLLNLLLFTACATTFVVGASIELNLVRALLWGVAACLMWYRRAEGRARTYTIRYHRVTPEGELDGEVALPGHATLNDARTVYANQCAEYERIGYRTAHARIVGPQGEVHDVEG